MNNRQLSNYVPIWLIYLAYAALALIITTYMWAFLNHTIPTELALRRLSGFGIFVIMISFIIYKSLKNKASEYEFIFRTNGRKIEAIINCSCLYLGVLLGIVLILSDIFNIVLFTPLSFMLVANLCIQIYFVAIFLKAQNKHPQPKLRA